MSDFTEKTQTKKHSLSYCNRTVGENSLWILDKISTLKYLYYYRGLAISTFRLITGSLFETAINDILQYQLLLFIALFSIRYSGDFVQITLLYVTAG